MELNKPFNLYANCIPVKGASRSTICDLQRNQVKIIPNDLFEILEVYEGNSIEQIQKKFKNKYDEIIKEYFIFLLENEFIFFTDTPNLFPKISTSWDTPSSITNAIIDFDEQSNHEFENIINQLNLLNCINLEVRFFHKVKRSYIDKILDYVEEKKTTIQTIDITLPFNEESKKLESFLSKFNRLTSLKIFNAPFDKFISQIEENNGYIIYTQKKIENENHCGIISKNFFVVNIPTYTESINFNSCLNRKIGIDKRGNIKNCPTMTESFGNISNKKISDAINEEGFKKYWGITKDKINVCKDCEFRYICTDCRAFVESKYDKPLKCGYNPYTNIWEEWSLNTLKNQ
ncbi:grasp-with-spasm system SPASM domain peptide maturase [Tenacibaculum sp. 1B UA]|uniref:grasp-with-spasm system SPASM domain peptide maturase n=1 Tax=Tenacibaculum sp. 1B UA TaxID=2922252 RepID=UPI002A23A88A|nr:grasp-with-spasm system SPASM domain peptide maturase [Tenacibaculum sp. 1B UA]MDX8554297.1 grasp-with-spasm system SPASM domain peptide maturase [Tenacibaculum sp. 1B UA]